MKKKISILFYLFITFLVSIYFFPKENFYYFIEEKLFKQNIIIDEKKVIVGFNNFEIEQGKVFFNNNSLFNFSNIILNINIFSNNINVKNIKMENFVKNFVKENIKELNFNINIFNYKKIKGFVIFEKKYDFLISIEENNIKIIFFDKNILNSPIKNLLKNGKNLKEGIEYEFKYNN